MIILVFYYDSWDCMHRELRAIFADIEKFKDSDYYKDFVNKKYPIYEFYKSENNNDFIDGHYSLNYLESKDLIEYE